ncbi:MAG: hypothetical protein HYR55_07045 [Acidobacteria bacterium]|nr:hypothetical protein [Acidobacteriota bacterium]MBI3656235.1 hypothetical protein [Acidobacteriota bacterium]
MRRRLFGFMMLLAIFPAYLFGQRVKAQLKADPISTNRELSFALNYSGDLKAVPNIVFAMVDGQPRGFVSYPSVIDTSVNPPRFTTLSGNVVVFNPNAEPVILEEGTRRIKPERVIALGNYGTPPKPARPLQMTLSPDGRILAVVNVDSNAISIIDVQSADLKGTIQLERGQFGSSNNVIFAPGGTREQGYTAYISSFRQDDRFIPIEGEVLQFRIRPDLSGELVGRLTVGIGPTALSLSEDGSVLAVVNIYYRTQRARIIFPAYISLIDTASFRVKADLRPNAGETFYFDGNTTPVLLPLTDAAGRRHNVVIVAGQGAAVSLAGRALLFDADSGSLLATSTLGSKPTVITVAPGGSSTNRTVMISNTPPSGLFIVGSIARLDLDGAKLFSDDAQTRQEAVNNQALLTNGSLAPVSRPAFLMDPTRADQRRLFLPVTSIDRVVTFDVDSGAIDTATLVGDIQDRVQDLPVNLTATPDRETIAVLNFGSATIDMLVNGYHLDFPFLQNSDKLFTRLNVVNTGTRSTNSSFNLLSDGGTPLVTRPPMTAALLALGPNFQFGQTALGLFDLTTDTLTNGWVDLSTDSPNLLGSYLIGNNSTSSLDGATPVYRHLSRKSTRLTFTEVLQSEKESSQVTLVNPTYSLASVSLQLYKPTGEKIGDRPVTLALPGRAKLSRFLTELYPTGLDDFSFGYLNVESNVGLIGLNLALFQTGETNYSAVGLNPVTVTASSPNPTTYFLPYTTVGAGYDTLLNIINMASPPTDETTPPTNAELTITFYKKDGAIVGAPARRTVGPLKQLREGLLSLLDSPTLPVTAGYVKIDMAGPTAPVAISSLLFGPDKGFAAAVPVLSQGQTNWLILDVLNNLPMDSFYLTESLITALALTNIDTAPANVTLEVFDANGQAVAGTRTQFNIPPNQQVSKFLDEMLPLPGPLSQAGGTIRIGSTQKLLAVQVLMATALGSRDYLVCLPAQGP